MSKHDARTLGEKGFTIVELMIATMVFATVLMVVTFGILQITRVYFKGVTETNTQNTARSVIDIISQAIQFGGGNVKPTINGAATPANPLAFCIGNQRFSYTLGYQVTENAPDIAKHQGYHALAVDTNAGCTQATPQALNAPAISGRELLSPNMRLTKLKIESAGGQLYRVTVRIVYGDDDLLSADPTADPNVNCKAVRAGTQFCAMSELSTIVVKRVE